MEILNSEGLEYLGGIKENTVDLVLTDPPYIISHDTGMELHSNAVADADGKNMKTEKEWCAFKKAKKYENDDYKENYVKYGSIYGKKYCVRTNYGNWDSQFTMEILEEFIKEFYKKLKKGGTLIMFFDLWKITILKDLLEKHKFKQIRMIEWIKTNPQPLNASLNYLTNCREIALTAVKGSKPTFNSRMDRGIYEFPMAAGWYKFHPTQKNLELIKTLIEKHTKIGDTVLDTFLGGGTTAYACRASNRVFKGCEANDTFYEEIIKRITPP